MSACSKRTILWQWKSFNEHIFVTSSSTHVYWKDKSEEKQWSNQVQYWFKLCLNKSLCRIRIYHKGKKRMSSIHRQLNKVKQLSSVSTQLSTAKLRKRKEKSFLSRINCRKENSFPRWDYQQTRINHISLISFLSCLFNPDER